MAITNPAPFRVAPSRFNSDVPELHRCHGPLRVVQPSGIDSGQDIQSVLF
jgi:hypothetical protein